MRLSKVGLAIAGIVTVALAVTGCSETGSTSASTSAGGSAAATSCTKAAPSTAASPSPAASSAAASAPAASSAAPSAPPATAGAAGLVEKGKAGTLTIGVKFDQPGLGLKAADGSMSGFDIEVAKYVAKKLGVEEAGITWKETPSAQRETALQNQEVDLVVATRSPTSASRSWTSPGRTSSRIRTCWSSRTTRPSAVPTT